MSGRGKDDIARNLHMGGGKPYLSPGARKEKLLERSYARAPGRAPLPYAELRTASAFSFLDGASLPEDLVARAAELGLPAVALVDRNGVYGAPRFYKAARAAGLRALVGAEVALGDLPASRLTLLVEPPAGYRNLCKLLTAAALGKPKGAAAASFEEVEAAEAAARADRRRGGTARAGVGGPRRGADPARTVLERLAALFPGRLHVELQRHGLREEERRNQALVDLAARLRLPLVATNGVRYARSEDKPLHDVLTAHPPPDDARRAPGRRLAAHRERHLKRAGRDGRVSSPIFPRPSPQRRRARRAARLHARRPRLPLPRLPASPRARRRPPISGRSPGTRARARFRPLSARAQAQLGKELAMIEKLDLAGYFLIVWDIVEFCRREKILCQGRGSAANSAVCYALGHHRRRPGEDGAAVRALPLRGARRVARHRPRPALGRPAREGHPVRLPTLRARAARR